jgi:hypothetical protein
MLRYSFHSLPKVVLTFLLLGPSLWPLSTIVVGIFRQDIALGFPDPVALLLGIPLSAVWGAMLWWWASFQGNTWSFTWLPTVVAAFVYWIIMQTACDRVRLAYKTRARWLALNSLLCSLVSVLVFFLIVTSSSFFGADFGALPIKLKNQISPTSWAALTSFVVVVGITGAILGILLGALARTLPIASAEGMAFEAPTSTHPRL